MKPAFVLAALCLLLSCGDSEREAESPPSEDAGMHFPLPERLASIRNVRLDALAGDDAEAICREDAARHDACLEQALGGLFVASDPESCSEAVAQCRAAAPDAGAEDTCGGFELGPRGSCGTTVEEYIRCLDDWNGLQSCENAGLLLSTPDACRGVVEACPRLAPLFFRSGTPPPCAPETADRPPRLEEDIYGFDGCRPIPSRFVVLGDSIASCLFLGDAECGPSIIGRYIQGTYTPDLVRVSFATPGAVMADLPTQAEAVEPGPGHVAVWIHILGNDLVRRQIDERAWELAWNRVFDHFSDPARFPDGATFMLNTQYGTADQCPDAPGTTISRAADELLQDINERVFIALAEERGDTLTIDQYTDWLGHGNNANVHGCPHCGADNTTWMQPDKTHPNPLGYAHMADKWKVAVDRMYGPGCD